MLVIVDRPQLLRMIALVRDDRRPPLHGEDAPFVRIEASGESLIVTGQVVEATFPATVMEPGVLFLRVYKFRKLLHGLRSEKTLTIQANGDGLLMGPLRLSLEHNDMLLYADPAQAPRLHPAERLPNENTKTDDAPPTLFDSAGLPPDNGTPKPGETMRIPFVIDNDKVKAAEVLGALLGESAGCPLDIATAYFSISGYRLLKDGLHGLGAFRLLIGAEPQAGADVGLRPSAKAVAAWMRGEMEAQPFTEGTLRLVEDLIAFLRGQKVQVRLFEEGFLHAKAYIFHRDRVGPGNLDDRLRPYAAIVGSSNFTGSGLTTNQELKPPKPPSPRQSRSPAPGVAAKSNFLSVKQLVFQYTPTDTQNESFGAKGV